MALCVHAKQPMQAQVEAVHNLSFQYDIYGVPMNAAFLRLYFWLYDRAFNAEQYQRIGQLMHQHQGF
jgi:hypothetical protein